MASMVTRKSIKILHTAGAVGLTGALVSHLILLSILPEPEALAEYAAVRQGIAAIAQWMLFPSLVLVLVSGMLSLAASKVYLNAGWAWVKALLGVSVFEGSLIAIQGPAKQAAERATQAVVDGVPVSVESTVHSETGAIWVILLVAVANIVLGVWRPRFERRRAARDEASV